MKEKNYFVSGMVILITLLVLARVSIRQKNDAIQPQVALESKIEKELDPETEAPPSGLLVEGLRDLAHLNSAQKPDSKPKPNSAPELIITPISTEALESSK